MRYRLIAVDVDGTLLRSDGSISRRTRDALATALQRGATLAVATGRRRRTALPIVEQLGLPHYLIASQGAVTWDGDTIVAHAHLPLESARRALHILEQRGMVSIIFSNSLKPEIIWVSGDWRGNERIAKYLLEGDRGNNVHIMRELTGDDMQDDPVQFIVFDTIDRLEALNEELTGHAPPPPSVDPPAQEGPTERRPLWRVIFSRNQFTAGGAIEIVGPETSKAHALDDLCRRLGIRPGEVIAFGDNINDVEMLEFAGLGVAMANGTEDAFRAADRVGPSNDDDGIAVVLEEVGLA